MDQDGPPGAVGPLALPGSQPRPRPRRCPGSAKRLGPLLPGLPEPLPAPPRGHAEICASHPSPGLRGKGQSSAAFSEPARTRSSNIAASVGAPGAVRGARVAAEEWRSGAEGSAGSGAGVGRRPGRSGAGAGGRAGGGTAPSGRAAAGPRFTAGLFSITKARGEATLSRHVPRVAGADSHDAQAPAAAAAPGGKAAPGPPQNADGGIAPWAGGESPSGGASPRARPPPGRPRRRISFVPAARVCPDAACGERGDSSLSTN